jgi:hypothetical protein
VAVSFAYFLENSDAEDPGVDHGSSYTLQHLYLQRGFRIAKTVTVEGKAQAGHAYYCPH